MGKFLLLAFRNVFRNRRRTIMTFIMVGGGVAGLLLAGGYFAFMIHWPAREHHPLRPGTPADLHFRTLPPRRSSRARHRHRQTGGRWPRPSKPAITFAASRPASSSTAWFQTAKSPSVFMGSAVDPDAENSLGFSPNLVSGRDLTGKPSGEVEALIGSGLAKSMNVKAGDGLTLLAVTSDGALNGVDVQIAGVVSSGIAAMDARYLRITLPSAQRLLQSDRITNLVVGLDATANTDAVHAELGPHLNGLPATDDAQKMDRPGRLLRQVRTMFSGIFIFMGVIVFFMVLMSSVNTLLMAMFERTREVGTMLAMVRPCLDHCAVHGEASLLGIFGAVHWCCGRQSPRRAAQLFRPPFAAAPRLYGPHSLPSSSRARVDDRLFHPGHRLAGRGIHSAAIRASRLQIAEALAHV